MNPSEEVSAPPWWQVVAVGRNPSLTLVRLMGLAGLTVLTFWYGLVPVRVTGISMQPTYKDGERRWISPLWARVDGIHRGDVVAIQTSGRHLLYLKRIVALPGERIRIVRGEVQINGQSLEEPYVAPDRAKWSWPTNAAERVLGADEFFVVGDNRGMAMKSHSFGVADRGRILGKLVR